MRRLQPIIAAALLAASQAATALAETVAVIVNRDNPRKAMSRDEIQMVYTNSTLAWPDGTPIIIYDLSVQDPLRGAFSEKVLGKAPAKVAEEWAHLKITNQAKNPPMAVKSEALIIRRVAREKGAIGYVSLSAVVDNQDIRVVNTIQ